MRHAAHTTDKDDIVDFQCFNASVQKRLSALANNALNEFVYKHLELGPIELRVNILWAGHVGSNEGEAYLCLHCGQQLDLCLLNRFVNTLDSHSVKGQFQTPS
jgi:hypothetical protein